MKQVQYLSKLRDFLIKMFTGPVFLYRGRKFRVHVASGEGSSYIYVSDDRVIFLLLSYCTCIQNYRAKNYWATFYRD